MRRLERLHKQLSSNELDSEERMRIEEDVMISTDMISKSGMIENAT